MRHHILRLVPGIALSGFGMESDIQRSYDVGFSKHLIKPVNIDQLRANFTSNPTNRAFAQTARALNLPAEHLLVLRVLGGWMNILAQLDVTVAARAIVERWVPGFA